MPYRTSAGVAPAVKPCPACGAELDRTSVLGMDACRSCGGIWADIVASQRLVTYHDIHVIYVAEAAASDAVRPAPPDGARVCPVCRTSLVSSSFGVVALDVCTEHGTWFDRDELQRVARSLEFERQRRAPRPKAPDADEMKWVSGRTAMNLPFEETRAGVEEAERRRIEEAERRRIEEAERRRREE